MPENFRVGVTPDFYVDAQGKFEPWLRSKLDGVEGLEWSVMASRASPRVAARDIDAFDALFCLKIKLDADNLRGVDRTAVIARWGVGYDSIDVAALTAADIALAIAPDAVKRPVAEAILALIFTLSKNLREQDRLVRAGKWRQDMTRDGICLGGRALGSIGCGNIAQELFRIAASLGFRRLSAYDPYVDPARARALGVELVGIDEVFRERDFETVNCPLNDSTLGLIGAEHFRMMKASAFFINTARGPIVREAELIEALRDGRIAGAGLDVFEREPPPPDHPLFAMDNVVLCPHGLAWTEEVIRDNSRQACDNILAVFRGEAPPNIVNRDVLERPGFQAKLARRRG